MIFISGGVGCSSVKKKDHVPPVLKLCGSTATIHSGTKQGWERGDVGCAVDG